MEDAVIITADDQIKKNIQWPPRNLDYHGIARRVMQVETMPQGARLTYDRDIDVSAVVLDDKRKRRFQVIDRAIKRERG